jgi:hypothetical protein
MQSFLLFFIVVGIYLGQPVLLAWGWMRLFKRREPWRLVPTLSLIGFSLATASALLAISAAAYAYLVRSFPFHDPLLMRIYSWGMRLSLGGFLFGLAGVWRKGPLRWLAPVCAVGTLIFWVVAAWGE